MVMDRNSSYLPAFAASDAMITDYSSLIDSYLFDSIFSDNCYYVWNDILCMGIRIYSNVVVDVVYSYEEKP